MTPEENSKKIEFLERRVKREKNARIAAESILETKSKEVYLYNQKLVQAVSDLEKLTIAVEQSPIIVLLTNLAVHLSSALMTMKAIRPEEVVQIYMY